MRIQSFFALVKGRAGLKLAAVLVLCLAALGLFNADGRFVLVKQGVLPNLDFAEGAKYWSGSQASIALRPGPPPVLVLRNRTQRRTQISQVLETPTAYRYIRIGADVKADAVAAGGNWWEQAGIVLQSVDGDGARMRYWPSQVALVSGSTPWQRYEVVFPVSENANRLFLTIFLIGDSGALTVRDIAVDALDPALWFTIARVALIALWAGAGLWILVPLLRPKRRRLAAYGALFVFVATMAGVLTPQPQLSQFVGAARSLFDQAATPVLPDEPAMPREKPADDIAEPKTEPAPEPGAGARSPSTRVLAALPASVKRGGGSFAAHFAVHAALAFLVLLAFGEIGWLRVTAYLIVTAAVTEIAQVFVVTRTVNLVDGGYNLAGIGFGVAVFLLWRFALRWMRNPARGTVPTN